MRLLGNVFLVNMALADLVVTGLAIPAATIGLLANLSDWHTICQIQWNSVLLTCFVSAPSAAAAAADARLQIGVGPDRYLYVCLVTRPVGLISSTASSHRGLVTISRLAAILVVIWLSSAIGLVTFLTLDLGPDFCQSSNGHNSTSGWNWPLPAAITGVQVVHLTYLAVRFIMQMSDDLRHLRPPLVGFGSGTQLS